MKQKITIIGGGVLGAQIALMSAYHGYDTTVYLRSQASVERTRPRIARYRGLMLEDLAKTKALIGNPMGKFLYPRGLVSAFESATAESVDALIAQANERFDALLHLETDLKKALEGAYLVIETMSEDPQAKTAMYEQMRDLLDPDTLLVTNSSTLLPSRFAESTGRKEKYLALHFANSIWKHNTAEVMGHPQTDAKAYDAVVAFAADIGMVPLKMHKEQPGYILNTMLVPFLSAAQSLWAKGVADPQTVDLTWKLGTGAPAGPFEILDVVGLETAYNINQMKPNAHIEGTDENLIGKMLKEKIDRGETGVNAGKGFYTYPKK